MWTACSPTRSAGGADSLQTWHRLAAALGDDAARLRRGPGVDEERIVAAEGILGVRLPADYRAWLQLHDGQQLDMVEGVEGLSVLPGGAAWFVPLDRVLAHWQWERSFDLDDYDSIHETQDQKRVRFFVGHPRRITVAGSANLDGGNFVLDLIPGPNGTPGQLLEMTSECDFEVIGDSVSAYFDRIAELLEVGKLVVTTDDNGYETLVMPQGGDVRRLVRGQRQRPR